MSDAACLRAGIEPVSVSMAAQQAEDTTPDSELAVIIKDLNFSYVDRNVRKSQLLGPLSTNRHRRAQGSGVSWLTYYAALYDDPYFRC
jgi:hypothetical protein